MYHIVEQSFTKLVGNLEGVKLDLFCGCSYS